MLDLSDTIAAELLKHDIRVTLKRRRVIDYVANLGSPFTAEDACADLPDVGRATVYRTLKILHNADVICKVLMPGEEMAYSLLGMPESSQSEHRDRASHGHHHHVICTICDAVRLFTAEAIENSIKTLNSSLDGVLGKIVDHRLEIYDICPLCADQPQSTA